MIQKINFGLFQILLLIWTINAKIPTPPSMEKIDEQYSKLLGLPLTNEDGGTTVDGGAVAELPMVVPASSTEFDHNLMREIEVELFINEILQVYSSSQQLQHSEEQQKFLAKKERQCAAFLDVADEQQQQFTLSRVCDLWKFWRTLGDEFAKHNLLDAERQLQFTRRPIIATPKKINCHKMEQLIKDKQQQEWVQLFIYELKLLHFNTITRVLIKEYDDINQKWEFSKLFEPERIQNESNFAFQLRLLHTKVNSVETLRHIKSLLKRHLIGVQLYELEVYAPALFAPEIVDGKKLADLYLNMTTKIGQKVGRESAAEMGARIYLGRIWHLFGTFYRHKKNGQNIDDEYNAFINHRAKEFFGLYTRMDSYKLVYCHYIWNSVATLYNISITNNETEQNEAIKIKMPNASTIEQIQCELIEDHLRNIGHLLLAGNDTDAANEMPMVTTTITTRATNVFSEHFGNGENRERSKGKLKGFIVAHLCAKSEGEQSTEFGALLKQFPFLEDVIRNDLTEKQVEEKQIKNYIDFLDSKNSKKVEKLSRIALDALAYYQWFKATIGFLKNDHFEHTVAKCIKFIEMWLDTVDDGQDLGKDEHEYFSYLEEAHQKVVLFMEQKRREQQQNVVAAIGGDDDEQKCALVGQPPTANTTKSDDDDDQFGTTARTLKEMHEAIVGRLLKMKAFRDKVTRIEINIERLSTIIGDDTQIYKKLLNESQNNNNTKRKAVHKGKEPLWKEKPRQSPKAPVKGIQQNVSKSEERQNNSPSAITPLNDRDELNTLALLYQKVLITADMVDPSVLQLLNVSAVHFRYKDMLDSFLAIVSALEISDGSGEDDELARLQQLIMHTVQTEKFADKLTTFEQTKKRICAMENFVVWICQNGTLYAKSGLWRQFLDNLKAANLFFRSEVGQPSEADFVWQKMDCEEDQNYNRIFDQLADDRNILRLHLKIIFELAARIPSFYEFLNNAHNFSIIKKLCEKIAGKQNFSVYYEQIFAPQNDANDQKATARANEMALALTRAVRYILMVRNNRKKAQTPNYQRVQMQMFVILRIMELFEAEDESRTERMLCTVLPVVKLLSSSLNAEKHVKGGWTLATEHCLADQLDTDQLFADQRTNMAQWHAKFFGEFLPDASMDCALVKLIRQTVGALHTLSQLMGGDDEVRNLLLTSKHQQAVIAKLVDKTLFANKNHLLAAHYAQIVAAGDGDDHLHNDTAAADYHHRLLPNCVMADLFVLLTDYFDSKRALIISESLMDLWWLHFRLLYETVAAEPSKAAKYALLCTNLLEEMDKFLDNTKKLAPANAKKSSATASWAAKERDAIARTELEWVESSTAAVNGQQQQDNNTNDESVKQMHMERLQMMRIKLEQIGAGADDDDVETGKQFNKVVAALQSKSECRTNLLQILRPNDAKQLLDMLGVKYEKKEFEKNVKEKVNIDDGIKSTAEETPKKGRKNKRKGKKIKVGKGEEASATKSETQSEIRGEEKSEEKNDPKSETQSEIRGEEKSDEKNDQEKFGEENAEKNQKDVEKIEEENDAKFEEKSDSNEKAMKTAEKWDKFGTKMGTESKKKEQWQIKGKSFSTLSDLCDYEPLAQKYENGILNHLGQHEQGILDLCAFKKEIELRIGIMDQIRQQTVELIKRNDLEAKNDDDSGQTIELIENWRVQIRTLGTMPLQNGSSSDLLIAAQKLYEFLCQILVFQSGNERRPGQQIGGIKKDGTKGIEQHQQQHLIKQIHLKNMLLALLERKELNRIWTRFGVEDKWKKLHSVAKIQMPIVQFGALMDDYRRMLDQIEIDQDLFDAAANNGKDDCCTNCYLPPNFPLQSQHITTAQQWEAVKKSTENFEHYLASSSSNGNLAAQNVYEQKVGNALQRIGAIVDQWSDKQAQLLISGSLLLRAHTIGADVNLVCLTPGERLKVADFMGDNKGSECVHNKCVNEEQIWSLFCQICEDKHSSNVSKIESDSILIIHFTSDGIEFDISLVAIPKMDKLEKEALSVEMLDDLVAKFNLSIMEQKNMGRTLASYRSTLYIANLFYDNATTTTITACCVNSFSIIMAGHQSMNENGKNFRHLLMATKNWAKSNDIYSNKLGFLNGMALAIMAAKIVLFYPRAPLQFLLEKFFLIFSTRPAQIPTQLTKIDAHTFGALLSASIINPKELEMPVFTPTMNPLQNATRFVTHSNANVIRHEMAHALQQINSMKDAGTFDFAPLLNAPVPFKEKYENFLAINCIGEDIALAKAFCAFVEWRMRLQIIFDIDKKGGPVQTHLCPTPYQSEQPGQGEDTCKLSNKLLVGETTPFRPRFCKVWLLGIVSAQIDPVNLLAMAHKFDVTIKNHFHRMRRTNASREKSSSNSNSGGGGDGGAVNKNINNKLDIGGSASEWPPLELKTVLVKREQLLKLVQQK